MPIFISLRELCIYNPSGFVDFTDNSFHDHVPLNFPYLREAVFLGNNSRYTHTQIGIHCRRKEMIILHSSK